MSRHALLAAALLAAFSATGQTQARQSYTMQIRPAVDFVVGEGPSFASDNTVRVFTKDGTPTSVAYASYGAGQWGTMVAAGNIDGTGYGEMLTGPGPGDVYGPQIRAWMRDGTPIQKVNFYAYGTLKFGVNPATAFLDSDPAAEILSGAGPGEVFGPHVRGWNFDGTALSAVQKVNYFAYGTLKWGVNIAGGDIDGDTFSEILTGPGPGSVFGPQVRGWNYDGAALTSISKVNFNAYSGTSYGVKVAAGDIDADGFHEILTASVPPSGNTEYRCFDFDGVSVAPIPGCGGTPFATPGGHLASGDFNGDDQWELVCASGPGIQATVIAYDFSSGSQTTFVTFTPFAKSFGATVAAGGLGFY